MTQYTIKVILYKDDVLSKSSTVYDETFNEESFDYEAVLKWVQTQMAAASRIGNKVTSTISTLMSMLGAITS